MFLKGDDAMKSTWPLSSSLGSETSCSIASCTTTATLRGVLKPSIGASAAAQLEVEGVLLDKDTIPVWHCTLYTKLGLLYTMRSTENWGFTPRCRGFDKVASGT